MHFNILRGAAGLMSTRQAGGFFLPGAEFILQSRLNSLPVVAAFITFILEGPADSIHPGFPIKPTGCL
jgi:hypothetical protein